MPRASNPRPIAPPSLPTFSTAFRCDSTARPSAPAPRAASAASETAASRARGQWIRPCLPRRARAAGGAKLRRHAATRRAQPQLGLRLPRLRHAPRRAVDRQGPPAGLPGGGGRRRVRRREPRAELLHAAHGRRARGRRAPPARAHRQRPEVVPRAGAAA
eukprot:6395237-Prymnesium_polylepis.1